MLIKFFHPTQNILSTFTLKNFLVQTLYFIPLAFYKLCCLLQRFLYRAVHRGVCGVLFQIRFWKEQGGEGKNQLGLITFFDKKNIIYIHTYIYIYFSKILYQPNTSCKSKSSQSLSQGKFAAHVRPCAMHSSVVVLEIFQRIAFILILLFDAYISGNNFFHFCSNTIKILE